jgi:hypothetical protein
LQQTLTPPVTHPAEEFGAAVALEDNTAVVGAPIFGSPGSPTNSAAFIYERTGANFVLQQELQAPPSITEFNYAVAVAVHDGTVVVGDPERTVNGEISAGAADIFQFNGTSWVLVQTITPPDAGTEINSPFGKFFGSALDIGPSGIIAGAHTDSSVAVGAGAAYIFSPSETNQLVIVSASASPNRLFPPNHKFVPVTVSLTTQGTGVTCKITSVSSNQPINGTGDGNTSPDWIVTGDLTVLLRAERAGNIKTDRIYTITVQCTDAFGNTATTNVHVTVPHDNGK